MTRPPAPRPRIDWGFWGPWLVCAGSLLAPLIAAWLIYFADPGVL